MALAAAQTAAHAESWAWQLLAHTPFSTAPRTPLTLPLMLPLMLPLTRVHYTSVWEAPWWR